MSFIKEFKLLLKARYPILYIPTTEEERVEYVIRSCVQLYSNRGIYAWDFVDGYVGNPNDNGFASRNPLQALELIERLTPTNPAVFLLKDFHLFLSDISVARKLKNLTKVLRNQSKNIIIIADEVSIPDSLKDIITVLDFQLPQPSEIKKELLRVQESLGYNIPEASLNSLVSSCQGLSLERIRRVLSKIIATYKEVNIESLEQSRQILATQFRVYPNYDISQVLNFSMYGSLSERFRVSITKIINYFPAALEVVFTSDDFVAQTAQALHNVFAVLQAAGAGPQHMVRMTWYITDRNTYVSRLKEVGTVYREIMGKNYPAMTCIVVQGLVEIRALVEIEVTAVKP